MDVDDRRSQFRLLHESGCFIIPNPHDVGGCRLLTSLGFSALATTSGGHAASMGRMDMTVSRSEIVAHVTAIVKSTHLPVSVDAEQCFPDDSGGVRATIKLLADAGAAGCSIEDWNPTDCRIEDLDVATARVAEAAQEADVHGMVLTARAENHLHGVHDIDDTIQRLKAFREAGAHVVYAPAVVGLDMVERIVIETGAPVNVLLVPGGPPAEELERLGVRRLSVGSALTRIAYGAFVQAARRLLSDGQLDEFGEYLDRNMASQSFAS